jgi:hypothetical protein
MRGYERNNFPAFDAASAKLRADGHEVFNPAERDREEYGPAIEFGDVPEFDIRDALGADLAWICEHAEGVAMLPGWENSRGAKAEWATAVALGLEIRYRLR